MITQGQGPRIERKSLKDCTDDEIRVLFQRALDEIRQTPSQYGVIKAEVSGGKVKFLTVERPLL